MLQITDLFVIKSACVNFLEQEPTIYNQKKTLLNGWSTDDIQLKNGYSLVKSLNDRSITMPDHYC